MYKTAFTKQNRIFSAGYYRYIAGNITSLTSAVTKHTTKITNVSDGYYYPEVVYTYEQGLLNKVTKIGIPLQK